MNILSLNNITLHLAGPAILDQVSWQIGARDRIALVGRNGAGKSTLIRLLQGEITHDSGQLHQKQGLVVSGLMQDVPANQARDLVYHVLVKGLGHAGDILHRYYDATRAQDKETLAVCQQQMDDLHLWNRLPDIEAIASHLGIDLHTPMQALSGGMKRRVLLAQALLTSPDLLLLDEPTNHLDVTSIEWLENYLKTFPGAVLIVTHDKAFLKAVATQIVEIDRGHLYSYPCDYDTYLTRKEQSLHNEQRQYELFDKRLSEEEAWIRTGIKARRTRNEGRVRALKAMRETYQKRRISLGQVKQMALEVERSGQLVLEATDVSYQINDTPLICHFSHLITKGDKIGIIGPNGCGKTTLVRLLLGELQAQSGTIRRGSALSVAYFDQLRQQLDETDTVLNNVADGSDYVTIGGQNKHVASYLKDFLFTPDRFNQPVSSLSGGERNRLLLAKLFARPVNFLVLDEPTNDLDMETLDLLESMLVEYTGTLLLISHDRDFLNQVATSVLVYEGQGHFQEYYGGYDDYKRIVQQAKSIPPSSKLPKVAAIPVAPGLSASEHRELSKLMSQIESTENRIEELHLKMGEPGFYQGSNEHIETVQHQLNELQSKLNTLYERWEYLESRK